MATKIDGAGTRIPHELMKRVGSVSVEDPDTLKMVRVIMFKTEGGDMLGLDATYLEHRQGKRRSDSTPIWSPFERGAELIEDTDV